MSNNVMVFVGDQIHIDAVKSSIHQARTTGNWKDDIVVILPEGTEHDLKEEVFYSNLTVVDNKFHKLTIFNEYFKKWDWIFFCDLDTIILDKINLNLENRDERKLYANPDGRKDLDYQFMIPVKEINDLLTYTQNDWQRLANHIGDQTPLKGNASAFQTCMFLFHSSTINWKKTKEFYCWLNPFTATRNGGTLADQGIINLMYLLNHEIIGSQFVNRCQVVADNFYELELLKKGVTDPANYEAAQILHFGWVFAPWHEWNLRWHPIWCEHLSKYKDL